jgi:hypothetical protein
VAVNAWRRDQSSEVPGKHVFDGELVKESAAKDDTQRAAAQGLLEASQLTGAEVARLVELDSARGVFREEPVEDDDVKVEVGIEG